MQSLYIFTQEPWFTLSPEVISLLTYYQGRSAGFTMKSFKGSSNKLVAVIGFQSAREYRAPLPMAHSAQAIHIGTEAALYSARQAPFAPFRVTTNKL